MVNHNSDPGDTLLWSLAITVVEFRKNMVTDRWNNFFVTVVSILRRKFLALWYFLFMNRSTGKR